MTLPLQTFFAISFSYNRKGICMHHFDFEKLCESNSILWKWAEYFKIENNNFLNFSYKLPKNYQMFLDKIEDPNDRKIFKKDFKKMFFAREIENDLFKQYHPVILSSLRKFPIKDREIFEFAYDVGVSSLRGAIWRYRIITTKFLSYAMTGIIQAIRGAIFYKNNKKINSKIKVVNIMMDEENGRLFAEDNKMSCKKTHEPWQLIEDGVKLNEKSLVKLAKLTADEAMLLKLRLKDDNNYRSSYVKYYAEKHGVTCTKSTIYRHWNKVKFKIYLKLYEIRGRDALIYRESALCHIRQ